MDWLNKNVSRYTATTQMRPKDRLTEDVIAAKLKEFMAAYPGTYPVTMILAADPEDGQIVEPWHTFRRILREHTGGAASAEDLFTRTRTTADSAAAGQRFGAGIAAWDALKQQQRLLLTGEVYQDLRRRADQQIADLQRRARESFDGTMKEARRLAEGGNKTQARVLLRGVIDNYGIPDLVREAQTELDRLK